MKRTNVILDEKLLEEARRESGEKTYSAVIMKALADYVRQLRHRRAVKALHGAGLNDDDWYPGFLDEHLKNPRIQKTPVGSPKRGVAAHERRLPKKSTKRGSR